MPTTTLDPLAIGTYDAWTLTAGATKMAAVTAPDDAGATRLSSASASHKQTFTADALPLGAAIVEQVDHIIRTQRYAGAGAGTVQHLRRHQATDVDCAGDHDTGAYADYTDSDIARPGGGIWLPSDFGASNAEFGAQTITMGAADGFDWDTQKVDVTWRTGGGMYSWMVSKWLLPVLPLLGSGLNMADVTRHIFRRTRLSEEELRRMLEWTQRRPVYGY